MVEVEEGDADGGFAKGFANMVDICRFPSCKSDANQKISKCHPTVLPDESEFCDIFAKLP